MPHHAAPHQASPGLTVPRIGRHVVTLPEGCWAEIMPLTFDRARLIVTDGFGVFDGW